MELIKMVVEAGSGDAYLQAPQFAVVGISTEFLQRVLELSGICKGRNLQNVSVACSPDEWDNADELRLVDDSLLISGDFFWFEATPKHSASEVFTSLVEISRLIEAVNLGREYPDMLLKSGVLYCGSIPEELADTYIECQASEPAAKAGS